MGGTAFKKFGPGQTLGVTRPDGEKVGTKRRDKKRLKRRITEREHGPWHKNK